MPRKRIAELYISIGHHKQGKTEFYRDFLHHLAQSNDQFEPTPGDRGMVMATFALPSYDIVFKIFRDRFADPKTVSRQQVMEKYNLVFRHDRAGRLVDAQEFEHLEIERDRFSPALLDELGRLASQTVVIEDRHIHIRHAYIERRVTPLNLFLQRATESAARYVIIDYGNAIKDLAASNIFPGDILLKNFGVTRHGRVVFYDYDALCLITDCRFSRMPKPRDETEELAGEEWFYSAENEFYPEELRTFLGLDEELRNVFIAHHGDLFQFDYWLGIQKRINANEVIGILPQSHTPTYAATWSDCANKRLAAEE
jgi:isocitrate dehydrogenase kinase/phosphatase